MPPLLCLLCWDLYLTVYGWDWSCGVTPRHVAGRAQPPRGGGQSAARGGGDTRSAMALRAELLKSIWHAFTALDVDKSGKVSKSQLKVSFLIRYNDVF